MSTTMRVFLAVAVAAGAVALAGCNTQEYYGGIADDLNNYVERERNERGELPAEFRRFRLENFQDVPQRRPDAVDRAGADPETVTGRRVGKRFQFVRHHEKAD